MNLNAATTPAPAPQAVRQSASRWKANAAAQAIPSLMNPVALQSAIQRNLVLMDVKLFVIAWLVVVAMLAMFLQMKKIVLLSAGFLIVVNLL